MRGVILSVFLLGCLLADSSAIAADGPLVVNVWPGKPAGDVGIDKDEWVRPSPPGPSPSTLIGFVSKPTMTVCRAPKDRANGAAVIICPGGGYHDLAWDKEGTEVADWLNTFGVTGIVLKYRVPRRSGENASRAAARPTERRPTGRQPRAQARPRNGGSTRNGSASSVFRPGDIWRRPRPRTSTRGPTRRSMRRIRPVAVPISPSWYIRRI